MSHMNHVTNNTRPRHLKRPYPKFNVEEIAKLKSQFEAGLSYETMAKDEFWKSRELSASALGHRARRLGLTRPGRPSNHPAGRTPAV